MRLPWGRSFEGALDALPSLKPLSARSHRGRVAGQRLPRGVFRFIFGITLC